MDEMDVEETDKASPAASVKKASGSDEGSGIRGKKRKAEVLDPNCKIFSCSDPKKKGAGYCNWHNGFWENVVAQCSLEQKQKVLDLQDGVENDMVEEQEESHIGGKFARKPKIDFARWEQKYFKKTYTKDEIRQGVSEVQPCQGVGGSRLENA